MKNGHLIEILNGYDKDVEVIIDGSTQFIIEQTGSECDYQIIIIKQ